MAFEIGPRNLDRKRIVLVKYNPAKINYESICEKLNSWVSNPEITQNIKITGY